MPTEFGGWVGRAHRLVGECERSEAEQGDYCGANSFMTPLDAFRCDLGYYHGDQAREPAPSADERMAEIERLVQRAELWKRAALAGQDDLKVMRERARAAERDLSRLRETVAFSEKSYLAEHGNWGECKWRLKVEAAEALLVQALQALHDATERERLEGTP